MACHSCGLINAYYVSFYSEDEKNNFFEPGVAAT